MNRHEFVLDVIEEMVSFTRDYKQMSAADPIRYPAEMPRMQWECEILSWWRKRREGDG
jgi:hypothetical protein